MQATADPRRFGLQESDLKKLLDNAGETYETMGDCFLRADRLPEVLAAFQKGQAAAPNAGLLEFNLARLDARSGKPAEALARLEKALPLGPSSSWANPYELLAEVLKKLGREKELTERLEKLRAADGANATLGYFLAGQYGRQGQPDKAESLYLAVLKKTPTVAGYADVLQLCRKGKRADTLLTVLGDATEKEGVLEALGAEEKAIVADAALLGGIVAAARARLKSGPEKLDFGMRKAVALLALEAKQYAVAEEFFNLAIAERPKQAADLLQIWGLGLLIDDRAAEAAKVFQRGIDLKPAEDDEVALLYYLGGALAMSNRTDEALAAARKAADMRRYSPRFCSRVPWILEHAKRYDEAIAAYTALLARFDGDRSARMREILRDCAVVARQARLGRLHGRHPGGQPGRRPRARNPRRPSRARSSLSGLCVLKHRLPEAEEWLQQVLDEFPDDVGASNDLGYLWADQGVHLDRAWQMIGRAVAAEPENAAYRDSLGWILYRLGRFPEAVVELEKAAAKEPAAEVLEHLGDAQLKAGQVEKANSAWRRAAAAFRKDKEEEKAAAVEKKYPGETLRTWKGNRTHVRPFALVHHQTQESGR